MPGEVCVSDSGGGSDCINGGGGDDTLLLFSDKADFEIVTLAGVTKIYGLDSTGLAYAYWTDTIRMINVETIMFAAQEVDVETSGIGGEYSSMVDNGVAPEQYTTFAHEVGHNIGMNHEEAKAYVGPEYARAAMCGGNYTIMYSASPAAKTLHHILHLTYLAVVRFVVMKMQLTMLAFWKKTLWQLHSAVRVLSRWAWYRLLKLLFQAMNKMAW